MATDLSRQIVGRRACFPCETPDGSVWIAFTEIEAKYAMGATSRTEALRQLAYAAYWRADTPLEAKMAGIIVDLFGRS